VTVELDGACVVVTGGGHGIGRALAERFAAEGAKVVVADLLGPRAEKVAQRIGGLAVPGDVASSAAIGALVDRAVDAFGPIGVFCSNAGITGPSGLEASDDEIDQITRVNLLTHVWAARAVVPAMVENGGGHLVQTLSSAALISGPAPMGYTFTKHGALGFAEWLQITYADRGITVTCLCPNLVNTGMIGRNEDDEAAGTAHALPPGLGDVVQPEECAEQTLAAMREGRFLVLPHPQVGRSFRRKGEDYDGWLAHTTERLRPPRPASSAADG
jgi:NAD(P)-dependent dehydrogenase (short-subunit alcohol dehydrogenase family)